MSQDGELPSWVQLESFLDELSRTDGLRVHDASRFSRYISASRAHARSRPVEREKYTAEHLLEVATAEAEIGELADAIGWLLRPPRMDGWASLLQCALGGPFLAGGESDPARAAQFELWTAACCRAAGGVPVFAEPDLRVRVGGQSIAVAAKRISSRSKVDQRVAEARKQIEASTAEGEIGVVAMDMTAVLNVHSPVVSVGHVSELPAIRDQRHHEIGVLGRRVGQRASKGSRVRAATAYSRWSALLIREQRLVTARHWIAGPVPAFAQTDEQLKSFLVSWANLRA